MIFEYTLENINNIALHILNTQPHKVILFNGPMGAGKTTLIKALTQKLGVNKNTSSPTFSLVNEYKTNTNHLIYHFDLYRLQSEEEALDIGIEEYLYSGNWCFIEWPEKIPNLLPEEHSVITINTLNNGNRKIEITNTQKP